MISEYVSSFRVAAAPAVEPAQENVRLKYEASTVSVTVASHVAQRPSCHGMSVKPSGRFPIFCSEEALWFFDGWESSLR